MLQCSRMLTFKEYKCCFLKRKEKPSKIKILNSVLAHHYSEPYSKNAQEVEERCFGERTRFDQIQDTEWILCAKIRIQPRDRHFKFPVSFHSNMPKGARIHRKKRVGNLKLPNHSLLMNLFLPIDVNAD